MAKTKARTIFSCQNCGAQRPRWEGRCTDCGAWNTIVEETLSSPAENRGLIESSHTSSGSTLAQLSDNVEVDVALRLGTSYSELDRVLGGGLVKGSFVLLGGEPGIGKSTLLLQMAAGISSGNHEVLYVSGEESVNQTVLRAQRLGLRNKGVTVAAESNLNTILNLAKTKKPDVLIVDSIQTVFIPEISSAPGSVSQVRECAGQLMGLAKNDGISVFLIGHVTKEGNIAGPKVLEHIVDTVLSFEGDPHHQFRLLRAIKNRFGATHELGVFQMDSQGLREVANPSEMFLEERGANLVGSSVFCMMEGTRPLLCEVQALTIGSAMAMPRRNAIGFDIQRVHMLIAVLDKHAKADLSHSDVFVNIVGGLKIEEPAADLAVAAALLSSNGHQEVPAKICFFGEVGLTGEIRAVNFAEKRILEAQRLGFEKFVIPASCKKQISELPSAVLSRVSFIKNIGQLSTFLGAPIAKAKKTTSAIEPREFL